MGGGQSGDRRSLREELATTPYTRRFCCSSFFHVTWPGEALGGGRLGCHVSDLLPSASGDSRAAKALALRRF